MRGAARFPGGPRRALAAAALCGALAVPGGAGVPRAEEAPAAPMADYQFGLLRRGPAWTPGRNAATDSLQAGHMRNIVRMWEEGVLEGAGPFGDGGDLRGIFIFRADSAEQVLPLAARDPAIAAGRLRLELHPWRAPAGIGRPYRERKRQPGFRDSMVTWTLGLVKRGPGWAATDADGRAAARERHLAHVRAGLADGRLATGGPFGGDGELRGVVIVRGDSAAAQAFAAADPAIRDGTLALETHPVWMAWGTFSGDTLARR